jgi:hypothetical protein
MVGSDLRADRSLKAIHYERQSTRRCDLPVNIRRCIVQGSVQQSIRTFSETLSAYASELRLRHWRVLLDQILRFEIRPELGRDLRLH